ncbi:NTP transferase domain-containing protein [Natronomonas salina]|uniref:NTP transferase domain-containing protein n=1 Tax=Natronomonas salina TaxID=1710540 RepID=UPI0015B4AE10|nr:NTP transferase domain-containing protein [Natronomonas salina]QLD91262.1 NTP transferase domain-containing protein [Natronomonas salina]
MCGGRGTRLDRGEKPLFEVAGEPMVDRVLAALETSRVEAIHAVTSPLAPETAAHLEGRVPTVETDGDGYVADLGTALESVERPVLTVVSDLPLLAGDVVDRVLDVYETECRADGSSLTVCVPTALKEALGVSADSTRAHGGHELSPTGVNIVGVTDDETVHVSYDARLAVNVNRPDDAAVAEVLADGP